MQMYVNYYDRYVKFDFEKPTIGILLYKEKNDALVEQTLPKDTNIYASAYQLYLPNKDLLQAKVKEWIEEFEENEEMKKLEKDKYQKPIEAAGHYESNSFNRFLH